MFYLPFSGKFLLKAANIPVQFTLITRTLPFHKILIAKYYYNGSNQ